MAGIFSFKGKVCVVTGGSRGMGKEMCLAFAEYGAAGVVVASRKIGNCEELAQTIRSKYPSCDAIPAEANTNNWESCNKLYETVMAKYGRCDVLVNNAGGSPLYPSLLDITEEYFDKIIGLNLKGPFRLAALFGAKMCTQDEGGNIVFIGSNVSIIPTANETIYGSAKAALSYLTKAIANAYGPKVRCNSIMPGRFLTDISKAWDLPALEPEWKKTVALQRAGRPDEIVGSIIYLCSGASSFTTGTVLEVSGGAGGSEGMRDPRYDGTKGMAKL